jgi:DNA-binding GntR family transcriptional regulator
LRVAVLERLRGAILNGSLAPDLVLSENGLAARLAVSRTPVREALRVLEREGLVALRPGRKMVVAAPTIRDVKEIYGIRMIVEPEAARRIGPGDEDLLSRLEACVQRGREALRAGDRRALTAPDSDFHSALVSALDNHRLAQFLDSIHDLVVRFRLYSLEDDAWAREAVTDHAEVVALLRSGRRLEAAARIGRHLAAARGNLLARIEAGDATGVRASAG